MNWVYMTEKTAFFIVTAVETCNLTQIFWFYSELEILFSTDITAK
jgi:hypothetical protein